jgi:predicted transcriptional regulator of viral defense system
MKWRKLLEIVGQEPVFHSSLLLAGAVEQVDLGRQLSRWVKSGKLIQLRRGLYALAEPHQKNPPHPFLVANRLKRASYISLQSALEHHGLIPEYVPSITSVTTGRPEILSTPLGLYIFKHIKKELFFGYQLIDLGSGQSAFIASAEKALLDLLYLTPGSDNLNYLRELRLQNIESLNTELLLELAHTFESRKLWNAAQKIKTIAQETQQT